MRSPKRIQTVAVVITLVACPVISAVVFGSATYGIARAFGVAHDFAFSAVVGLGAFFANVTALTLALGRSESDDRTRELPIAEELHLHARAS
jgi:hypothetical protein